DDLWYEYVSLEEDADYSGAIVEGETNIAINDLFNIYIALEWLPETPTSPLIGVNSSPPYFYQTVCPMDDSSFQMVYTNAGAMVGASILNWHSGFTEKDKNSSNDIINYEVLFSDDSAGVYTDGEVIASASSDSLTARFELSESGYVAVKATNGLDESFSDVNFIYKEKLPPVAIQPQLLIFSNQGQSSNNLLLENFGESNLELTIKYDTSLFILSDELINLETGSSAEINIGVREDVDFTSKVSSSIILKTTGEYYPQIIHVTLYGNEPTSVEGEEVLLPDDYMISQPYPNPFNSTIRFKLSQAHSDYIQMDIYNLIGQKVFSQITFSSQQESIKWDGTDYYGSKVGSGLYFIRFSSGNNTIIRKAVLLK
ncbi:MAG: T9SS type A sorting domain-containing protein, partial [candidate division Zixibacteria bacterium]|nr:T9SS type A sorting domain-containing protein [candidate division Zixibacteria bacterium]